MQSWSVQLVVLLRLLLRSVAKPRPPWLSTMRRLLATLGCKMLLPQTPTLLTSASRRRKAVAKKKSATTEPSVTKSAKTGGKKRKPRTEPPVTTKRLRLTSKTPDAGEAPSAISSKLSTAVLETMRPSLFVGRQYSKVLNKIYSRAHAKTKRQWSESSLSLSQRKKKAVDAAKAAVAKWQALGRA